MRITPQEFRKLYKKAKDANTSMMVEIGGIKFLVDENEDKSFALYTMLEVVQSEGEEHWEYYALPTVDAVAKTSQLDDPDDGEEEDAKRVSEKWFPGESN